MRHGSVFSGIGGFDLAATWMGWENVFNCERDRFCRRILKHYWPTTKSYEDIKAFNANEYRGSIDVLSGGFPCQPFSQAGQRKGTADDRYLWPQMLRVVGDIQPRWVVGENVFGLLNWSGGMVFRQVLIDLEAEGYDVWPYVLPAAGVGAPHRRLRIFFVAHRMDDAGDIDWRSKWRESSVSGKGKSFPGPKSEDQSADKGGAATDADGDQRFEGGMHASGSEAADGYAGARDARGMGNAWENFPTEPPICGRDDGLPRQLDGISFSAWRKESLKAYGNAIVPKVALQIFKTIERVEATMT